MPIERSKRALCGLAFLFLLPMSATAQSSVYGKAGPWTLVRGEEIDGSVACHATMASGRRGQMMFAHTLELTSLGFKAPSSDAPGAPTEVEVWFDDARADSQIISMPNELDWRVYRSPNTEPDGLFDSFANRTTINFAYLVPGVGERIARFSLAGSNAMTKRTYDCVQNADVAAARAAEPPRQGQQARAYDWIIPEGGRLGPGLVSAGTMPDGMPVYVCGIHHGGGFHPGMTGMWTDACSIGYGGVEVTSRTFNVLTGQGRWRSFDGFVPEDAVEGGQEADGRKLYICRVDQPGFMVTGKYRPGFRGCSFGDGGGEVELSPFDILTF